VKVKRESYATQLFSKEFSNGVEFTFGKTDILHRGFSPVNRGSYKQNGFSH
jgi:hypothetical protein